MLGDTMVRTRGYYKEDSNVWGHYDKIGRFKC